MAEYIDRDVLLEKLNQEACDCEFMRLLSDIPAADVEPVVHGQWIRYHEADLGWDEYGYRCSKCKVELEDKNFWDMFKTRCPKCGARMDGEDNGRD